MYTMNNALKLVSLVFVLCAGMSVGSKAETAAPNKNQPMADCAKLCTDTLQNCILAAKAKSYQACVITPKPTTPPAFFDCYRACMAKNK